MNLPSYDVAVSENRLRYKFISIGVKGHLHKVIRRTLVYKRIILQYYPDFSDQLVVTGLDIEGIEQPVETAGIYIAFLARKR